MAVTISLKGRTGNIIFQISCCIAYALKHNIDWLIPQDTLNNSVWQNPFQSISISKPTMDEVRKALIPIYYKEPSHSYTEIPFEESWRHGTLIELDGFFQSYKYFEDYKEEIAAILGFRNLPNYHRTVSLHYRAGDYKNYPLLHPMVTMDYFTEAVGYFNDGEYSFDIFSDDIDWCMENLSEDFFESFGYGHEVHYYSQNDPLEDLYIYSMADNHIISNSTWSYCGSYFSNGKGTIITPDEDNWMGINNKHLDVSTLIPKDWIRIKY